MKSAFRLLLVGLLCGFLTDPVSAAATTLRYTGGGYQIGSSGEKIGVYGASPTGRPSGAGQGSLTDNSTGTASTTVAAGVGVTTLSFPIQLASMTTSAADLVTDYTPGYKFKILSVDFVTTTIGAGSGASQAINLEIGSTNLTGGVVTTTLTGTNTLGKLTSGTAVTANNTGSAAATISIEVAASGTVFTGGAGILLVKIQNMDTADGVASLITLANAIRSALVTIGWIKGSA